MSSPQATGLGAHARTPITVAPTSSEVQEPVQELRFPPQGSLTQAASTPTWTPTWPAWLHNPAQASTPPTRSPIVPLPQAVGLGTQTPCPATRRPTWSVPQLETSGPKSLQSTSWWKGTAALEESVVAASAT